MLRNLRKHVSVPDDLAERKAALKKSQERLARAEDTAKEVIPMTGSLKAHNEVNHYIQRLAHSYRSAR